jgi:hypothetical protein
VPELVSNITLEISSIYTNCAGLMALPRSPLISTAEEEKEAEDVVDHSTLPPG